MGYGGFHVEGYGLSTKKKGGGDRLEEGDANEAGVKNLNEHLRTQCRAIHDSVSKVDRNRALEKAWPCKRL